MSQSYSRQNYSLSPGDRVILTSPEHGNSLNNPVDGGRFACGGVIAVVKSGPWVYRVDWDNGTHNDYHHGDLRPEEAGASEPEPLHDPEPAPEPEAPERVPVLQYPKLGEVASLTWGVTYEDYREVGTILVCTAPTADNDGDARFAGEDGRDRWRPLKDCIKSTEPVYVLPPVGARPRWGAHSLRRTSCEWTPLWMIQPSCINPPSLASISYTKSDATL